MVQRRHVTDVVGALECLGDVGLRRGDGVLQVMLKLVDYRAPG